jgi:hypothetical protein
VKHEHVDQPRSNRGFILNDQQANFPFHGG